MLAYADVYPNEKTSQLTITVQCFLFIVEARELIKQLKTELNKVAYLGWKTTRSWNALKDNLEQGKTYHECVIVVPFYQSMAALFDHRNLGVSRNYKNVEAYIHPNRRIILIIPIQTVP